MSFLAGRLASQEGSYFLQESKLAVARIREKQRLPAVKPIADRDEISSAADVLPEVLRHSLPPKIFSSQSENSGSSLSKPPKWAVPIRPRACPTVSADALHPLRGYGHLPRVTFGPKRWQLPKSEGAVLASTANDLRLDKYDATTSPEKLKAQAEALFHIGSAFGIATALVFGGAAVIFGLTASRYELHTVDDIQNFGKELVQPRFEMFREHLAPLRTRAGALSGKWRLEKEGTPKESPFTKELSRTLGIKS